MKKLLAYLKRFFGEQPPKVITLDGNRVPAQKKVNLAKLMADIDTLPVFEFGSTVFFFDTYEAKITTGVIIGFYIDIHFNEIEMKYKLSNDKGGLSFSKNVKPEFVAHDKATLLLQICELQEVPAQQIGELLKVPE